MGTKRLPLEVRISVLEAARVICAAALKRADDDDVKDARALLDQGLSDTIDYLTRSLPHVREIAKILETSE